MTAATILPREDVARITARALIEVQAVHLRPSDPFTYTSGLKSPVYVDCRKLIGYPRLRATLMQMGVGTMAREVGLERFDAVAGGETAGIPFAAWMADLMGLPMQYIRKKPKGFGRGAQIEGAFTEGQRTLLVEDLATDGGSKVRFAEALREAGAEIAHCFVVFHHDIFPDSSNAMTRHGIALHTLARWSDVLKVARAEGALDAADLTEVEAFLDAPLAWSAKHGGIDRIDV